MDRMIDDRKGKIRKDGKGVVDSLRLPLYGILVAILILHKISES